MQDDEALTAARALLQRAPVFDGHNDLPWVIRQDKTARGDVLAYDLTRVTSAATPTFRACARRCRRAILGGVPADQRAHPARTTLELIDASAHRGRPSRRLPAGSQRRRFRARETRRKIASFIVIEGGVGLENSLGAVARLDAAGARMLIPCHNETLDWVDSATDEPAMAASTPSAARLSARQPPRHDRRRRACLARGDPTLLDVSEAPILFRIPTRSRSAIIRATRPTTCLSASRPMAASSWRPSCRASSRSPCAIG